MRDSADVVRWQRPDAGNLRGGRKGGSSHGRCEHSRTCRAAGVNVLVLLVGLSLLVAYAGAPGPEDFGNHRTAPRGTRPLRRSGQRVSRMRKSSTACGLPARKVPSKCGRGPLIDAETVSEIESYYAKKQLRDQARAGKNWNAWHAAIAWQRSRADWRRMKRSSGSNPVSSFEPRWPSPRSVMSRNPATMTANLDTADSKTDPSDLAAPRGPVARRTCAVPHVVLVSHVNPDPDSLASMLGVQALLESESPGKPMILTVDGMIARSENRAMVNYCRSRSSRSKPRP